MLRSVTALQTITSSEHGFALERWLVALFVAIASGLALFGSPAEAHPGHHLAVSPVHLRDAGAPHATAWQRGGAPPIAVASPHCPGESGACGCHLDGCAGHHETRIFVSPAGGPAPAWAGVMGRVAPIPPEEPRPQSVAVALKRTRAPPPL